MWQVKLILLDKKDVRKKYLALRNSFDKNTLLQYSESIAARLEQMRCIAEAENIMCFVSFGSEVHTHAIIKKWLLEGKNVCVPCIENISMGTRCMHAVRIRDFNELKKCGSYGILEPPLLRHNIADPESFDVIIVPGCVYDVNKNRMGYGGGFYDKYLAVTSRNCIKIGVCYDFQVIDQIPHDAHDIPLDSLVTEKRIIL